jgi:hypothetical protein
MKKVRAREAVLGNKLKVEEVLRHSFKTLRCLRLISVFLKMLRMQLMLSLLGRSLELML